MTVTRRTRNVNPRLGTYFGIFASMFAALVLMSLMFEQLGVNDHWLRLLMFAGPVVLYAVLGLAVAAQEPREFFAAGRRVPAFFNGLVLAVTALGSAAFVGLTGTLFMSGVDAMCLALGWCAGFVVMAVLLAPFLRKFGSYTIPSYLGRRFESRTLRIAAAALLSAPVLLFLLAEIRFTAYAAAWLLDTGPMAAILAVVAAAAAVVLAGGMRSLTWSSAAEAIATLFALAVCVTIVALILTNLPLPQMTHGNVLRVVNRLEVARGVPTILVPPLAFDFPGTEIEPLSKRYLQSFGHVGSLSFIIVMLTMVAGVAASPVLLARSGTTPGVYEARKSLGWAVLVAGIVVLTLSAAAVFLRFLFVDQLVGTVADHLPAWFATLRELGAASVDSKASLVALADIGFQRDAALFALPIAAGLPQALVYLALAGAVAAGLAAISAAITTLGAILSEDVLLGLADVGADDRARVGTARLATAGIALVVAWMAVAVPADPLQVFLWAVALSASVGFPALVLSVLWKRANGWGVLVGMASGFGSAAFFILLCETGALDLPSALAGFVGMPVAFAVTMVASLLTPAPARHVLELVRDMRVPGGETLYDREVRIERLKNIRRP